MECVIIWLGYVLQRERETQIPQNIIKENHFLFDQQTIETCWLFSDIIALLINLLPAFLLYKIKPVKC